MHRVRQGLQHRNDAVNETWICDAGRMSYREIGAPDRLKHGLVRGELGVPEAAGVDAAIEDAAARVSRLRDAGGAASIAVLASPHATNEDLFILRSFCDALGVETTGVATVRGDSDDLLIEAEKAANAAGARALGFPDAGALVERVRNGEIRGLIAMGHDVLEESGLGGVQALAELETLIVLDTRHSELERVAHVMIPVRHTAEKLGTLTNVAGRVQRVHPAVEPAWDARPEGAVIARLGQALGLEGFDGRFDPREVSRALAASHPDFAGLDWDGVGDTGRPLAGATGDTAGAST
jgi:NADH-quinone oxidoreductase subunit G